MAREITAEDRVRAFHRRATALALQKRAAEAVKARGGIAHLEKRLGVNASNAQKPMPRVLPLTDAEQKERAMLLEKQKAELMSREMTDEQFEARKELLRQQAEKLKAGTP